MKYTHFSEKGFHMNDEDLQCAKDVEQVADKYRVICEGLP